MYNIIFFKLLIDFLIASTVAQQSKYKHLGCFLGENLLSLGEESRVLTPISPQLCSKFCIEEHYTYFVLKNDTCYCSNDYISRLMKQFDSDCSLKCTGDNMTSCGGPPSYVSSYTTDDSKLESYQTHGGCPIPIYLGCYSESTGNRLLKGVAQYYPKDNTPRKCSEMCFKMGYLYFGVTDGSECWCGNQQPPKSSKVDEKNCNSPCNGDKGKFCGGKWKVGIYSTGITDYEPKKYIGCFIEEKRIGKYLSYDMERNNSPKRCMNLCNTQQFKYAVVKGSVCECKSYEPNDKLIKNQTDCNTLCSENPSENCGGSSTLQNVYGTLYTDVQEEMAMNYIGCFKSSIRHPILNGWKINDSRLTPKLCVQNCYSRLFSYAALLSSQECLCSSIKPFIDAKTEDKMCSIPCAGESGSTCGGIDAMNIYSTGLESKMDKIGNYYLGCFEDNQKNRIYQSFSKSFIATNTPEYCSSICFKNGYAYSGVTKMSECYCGNKSPDENVNHKLDDKECNSKCTGDVNQFCGSDLRTGIFATGLSGLNIDYQYMGCFVQDNSPRKRKYDLAKANTPKICSTICYDATYQFAGVVGMDCLCSNDPPKNYQKIDDSNCGSACTLESNKTCDGKDKIKMYNLGSVHGITNNGYTLKYPQPSKSVLNTTTITTTSIYTSDLRLGNNTPQSSSNINKPQIKTNTGDNAFLNINSYWNYEIYIPQEPDFEFVYYNNSEKNVYVENNELIIKPTVIKNKKIVMKGSLKLNGCTEYENPSKCGHTAQSFNILPPVMSAKVTTKNSSVFRYGEIEIVAKLPTGDWIVTEIALVSKDNERNKMVLLSKGNANLNCSGVDESTNTLRFGLQLDEKNNINSSLKVITASKSWSKDFHTFQFLWRPDSFMFKIDGQRHSFNSSKLDKMLFSSESYLSIGVSVGGMRNFPDKCLSNDHKKPWKNFSYKGMFHFFNDLDNWASTWNDEMSKLRIRSVKFLKINV